MDKMMNVFLEGFDNLEAVHSGYSIDPAVTKGYDVVVAVYNHEGYEGDAYVLWHRDGQYYESFGSHCSCYGLEEQFDFQDTAEVALKHRFLKGQPYGAQLLARQAVIDHFGWEE